MKINNTFYLKLLSNHEDFTGVQVTGEGRGRGLETDVTLRSSLDLNEGRDDAAAVRRTPVQFGSRAAEGSSFS